LTRTQRFFCEKSEFSQKIRDFGNGEAVGCATVESCSSLCPDAMSREPQ
jgi:hypothetical protein